MENHELLTQRTMNQTQKLKRCFNLILVVCTAGLLSGCVFYPRVAQRSVEFRGRVLDAETRLPIKGAKVYFVEAPQYPTYTDEDGRFRMEARTQMHWGGNAAGGDWPPGKSSDCEVSFPNYQTVLEFEMSRRKGDIGDVLLKPKK